MTGTIVSILTAAGPWAVAAVALVAFAETGLLAGIVLPGDSLLFSTGVMVAAGVIHVPLAAVIVAVALAAFLGEQFGYALGRTFGPRVFNRPGSRLLSPSHLDRAQAFFAKHGSRAVILARFVPFARTLVPVIAGVGTMSRRQFTWFNAMGAISWSTTMIVAGAVLGGVPLVANHIELVSLALVALSLAPITVGGLKARHHSPLEPLTPISESGA